MDTSEWKTSPRVTTRSDEVNHTEDDHMESPIDWQPTEDLSVPLMKKPMALVDLDVEENDAEMVDEYHFNIDRNGNLSSSGSWTSDSSFDTSGDSSDEDEESKSEKKSLPSSSSSESDSDNAVEYPVKISVAAVKKENVFRQPPAFFARQLVTYDSSTSSEEETEEEEEKESEAIIEIAKSQGPAETSNSEVGVAEFCPIRTQGEMAVDDLPPIEELSLTVGDETKLERVGRVSSIVDSLVVIQCISGAPGLAEDSLLFREDRSAIGKVFELLGPVVAPYCTVRFNSAEHARAEGMTVNMPVFFAPQRPEFSNIVLPSKLHQKGSDASWKNDNEPPLQCLDYSDDETERREKRKQRSRPMDGGTEEQSEEMPAGDVIERPRAASKRKDRRIRPEHSSPSAAHSELTQWSSSFGVVPGTTPPDPRQFASSPYPFWRGPPPGSWPQSPSSFNPTQSPCGPQPWTVPPVFDLSVPPPGWAPPQVPTASTCTPPAHVPQSPTSSIPAAAPDHFPASGNTEYKRYYEHYYKYYHEYYQSKSK